MKTRPTPQELQAAFDYDPSTGVLRWKIRPAQRMHVGDVAGGLKADGYVGIRLRGKTHQAHRVAWAIVAGTWPTGDVDHIDGDKANNRWSNLRDVSEAVNMQNQRRAQRGNQSGHLGVHWHPRRNEWRAVIKVDGRNRQIGAYKTADEASAAYIAAKRRLHPGCTL